MPVIFYFLLRNEVTKVSAKTNQWDWNLEKQKWVQIDFVKNTNPKFWTSEINLVT